MLKNGENDRQIMHKKEQLLRMQHLLNDNITKVGLFAIIFDNQAHQRVAETQTSLIIPTFMTFDSRITSNRENQPDSTPPEHRRFSPTKLSIFTIQKN